MSYAFANYEAMTVDELRNLTKIRGYCGCSRMRKQELCDVLRKGDRGQYVPRANSPARSPSRRANSPARRANSPARSPARRANSPQRRY